MSNGETYDIHNHGGAWVLRNAIEIGLDPDAEGFALKTIRCAIPHIASVEDFQREGSLNSKRAKRQFRFARNY